MKTFRFSLHSVVDVITNSSTVIYTYQEGCEIPAKELVNEMLKLSGETEKKADDIFYFGTFCKNEKYIDYLNERYEDEDDGEELNFPRLEGWGSLDYLGSVNAQKDWYEAYELSVLKGEIQKPRWMERAEEPNGDGFRPSTYLVLVPKEEKYKAFGEKIADLLGGIEADGGYNG